MHPIIQTEQLCHIYGQGTPFEHLAIENVDLSLERGEFVGVIGHTGSGKSTLIQHLNGLLKPTSGRVLFEGEDIWNSPQRTRQVRFQVGLVFQYPEYQLFEETVYKDIAFGPGNMGLEEGEIDRRVRWAAELVGISADLLEQSPFELSGGQKRRVAIAGVFAMEPSVLILDEPTAGLDPAGKENIIGHIEEYHREKNSTILLVSHSMEDMASMADRLLVMNDAHLCMDGTPRQVFSQAEQLRAMSLDVPAVTDICLRLKERGLPIDPSVYTPEEAVGAILAMKGGIGRA